MSKGGEMCRNRKLGIGFLWGGRNAEEDIISQGHRDYSELRSLEMTADKHMPAISQYEFRDEISARGREFLNK